MQFERSFTVDSAVDDVTNRVVTGLLTIGYRQLSSVPLQFQRGSRLARWLSASAEDWDRKVTVRLTPLNDGKSTNVDVCLRVSQMLDNSWVVQLTRIVKMPGYQFWERELDKVADVARGVPPSLFERYDASIRTRANQDLIIVSAGAAVIFLLICMVWFMGAAFGNVAGDPMSLYVVSLLTVILVIFFITIIYNVIMRVRWKRSGSTRAGTKIS